MRIIFDTQGKVVDLNVSIAELTILKNEPNLYAELEKVLQEVR